uniref:Uncharacterized protein n=1 Tax=Setaria italica TaxID=4555 RepID=K3ZPC1_SETIT
MLCLYTTTTQWKVADARAARLRPRRRGGLRLSRRMESVRACQLSLAENSVGVAVDASSTLGYRVRMAIVAACGGRLFPGTGTKLDRPPGVLDRVVGAAAPALPLAPVTAHQRRLCTGWSMHVMRYRCSDGRHVQHAWRHRTRSSTNARDASRRPEPQRRHVPRCCWSRSAGRPRSPRPTTWTPAARVNVEGARDDDARRSLTGS